MSQVIPHRSRLQFGLRTLFVAVAFIAMWLGWELRFIHERQEFLSDLKRRNLTYELVSEAAPSYQLLGSDYITWYDLPGPIAIPFWRRWLGDQAVLRISVGDVSKDGAEARRLFPEAGIIRDWRTECL